MGAHVKISRKLKRFNHDPEEDEDIEYEDEPIEKEHSISLGKGLSLLLVVLIVLFGLFVRDPDPFSIPAYSSRSTYVVQKGDSLWEIAKKQYPNENTMAKMQEIRELNHVKGNQIQVGQKLQLP